MSEFLVKKASKRLDEFWDKMIEVFFADFPEEVALEPARQLTKEEKDALSLAIRPEQSNSITPSTTDTRRSSKRGVESAVPPLLSLRPSLKRAPNVNAATKFWRLPEGIQGHLCDDDGDWIDDNDDEIKVKRISAARRQRMKVHRRVVQELWDNEDESVKERIRERAKQEVVVPEATEMEEELDAVVLVPLRAESTSSNGTITGRRACGTSRKIRPPGYIFRRAYAGKKKKKSKSKDSDGTSIAPAANDSRESTPATKSKPARRPRKAKAQKSNDRLPEAQQVATDEQTPPDAESPTIAQTMAEPPPETQSAPMETYQHYENRAQQELYAEYFEDATHLGDTTLQFDGTGDYDFNFNFDDAALSNDFNDAALSHDFGNAALSHDFGNAALSHDFGNTVPGYPLADANANVTPGFVFPVGFGSGPLGVPSSSRLADELNDLRVGFGQTGPAEWKGSAARPVARPLFKQPGVPSQNDTPTFAFGRQPRFRSLSTNDTPPATPAMATPGSSLHAPQTPTSKHAASAPQRSSPRSLSINDTPPATPAIATPGSSLHAPQTPTSKHAASAPKRSSPLAHPPMQPIPQRLHCFGEKAAVGKKAAAGKKREEVNAPGPAAASSPLQNASNVATASNPTASAPSTPSLPATPATPALVFTTTNNNRQRALEQARRDREKEMAAAAPKPGDVQLANPASNDYNLVVVVPADRPRRQIVPPKNRGAVISMLLEALKGSNAGDKRKAEEKAGPATAKSEYLLKIEWKFGRKDEVDADRHCSDLWSEVDLRIHTKRKIWKFVKLVWHWE
ncbi:hypothetical protein B0H13DRAFT_1917401 [Mycena leptocephala]|nr:hypothetical protein B0H13DRAFT_1917401 [Mycena leptocephala]